jgi:hypothetical protein
MTQKIDKEVVRRAFADKGYELLDEYVGASVKMRYICSCGGNAVTTWTAVRLGFLGCKACASKKLSASKTKEDTEEQVIASIREFIKKHGEFPCHNKIVETGAYWLNRGIIKLGGFDHFRKLLGYEREAKPKGYWQNIENVKVFLNEQFPLLVQNGHLPTYEMVRQVGSCPNFIKIHGGVEGLCKKLRLQPASGFLTRDRHFVRSYYELLLDEYLYSRGIDHEPEFKPFRGKAYRCDQKVGQNYIEIWGYPYGSSFKYTEAYNKKRRLKESLYKKHNLNLVHLESDVFRGVIQIVESRLNQTFSYLGYETEAKHPFTMSAIATQVSYPWTEDTVKEAIEQYMETFGEFPTQKAAHKNGHGQLVYRIEQFGGFHSFRDKMGISPWKKVSIWSDDRIKKELNELAVLLGRFPKQEDLGSALMNAVREGGGLIHFKKELGIELAKKENDHWNEHTVAEAIKLMIEKLGEFPTSKQLRDIGRFDLAHGIQKTGGYVHYRQLLGHELKEAPKGYWTDETVLIRLKEATAKLGHFPTQNELKAVDSKLLAGIGRRGGLIKFSKILKSP